MNSNLNTVAAGLWIGRRHAGNAQGNLLKCLAFVPTVGVCWRAAGELLASWVWVEEMSTGGRTSLFSAAHLGTRLACLQIRALPWTGGWQRIQVAGGDKAASGTLQMQALAEWRLDGEQGKLRPLIMLPMFTAATQEWGICKAVKRLQTSTDLYKPVVAHTANNEIFWCCLFFTTSPLLRQRRREEKIETAAFHAKLHSWIFSTICCFEIFIFRQIQNLTSVFVIQLPFSAHTHNSVEAQCGSALPPSLFPIVFTSLTSMRFPMDC